MKNLMLLFHNLWQGFYSLYLRKFFLLSFLMQQKQTCYLDFNVHKTHKRLHPLLCIYVEATPLNPQGAAESKLDIARWLCIKSQVYQEAWSASVPAFTVAWFSHRNFAANSTLSSIQPFNLVFPYFSPSIVSIMLLYSFLLEANLNPFIKRQAGRMDRWMRGKTDSYSYCHVNRKATEIFTISVNSTWS